MNTTQKITKSTKEQIPRSISLYYLSQNSNSSNLEKLKNFLNYNKDVFSNDHLKFNAGHNKESVLDNYRLLRFESAGNSNETHKSNLNGNKKEMLIQEDASSLSSSDADDAEDQYPNNDYENDEEFQVILKQITFKNGKILMKKLQNSSSNNSNDYLPLETKSFNNQIEDANLNPTSITITTLKYLFKLLRFYKLEHYMSDLIEQGYHTPISLHKLKQNDLDAFNVSPYDKKKFLKLQLFIKQLITTINKSKNHTHNTNNNRRLDENEMEKDKKLYPKHEELNAKTMGSTSIYNKPWTNENKEIKSARSDINKKDINNNFDHLIRGDVKSDDDDDSSYVNFHPKPNSDLNMHKNNEQVKSDQPFKSKSIEPNWEEPKTSAPFSGNDQINKIKSSNTTKNFKPSNSKIFHSQQRAKSSETIKNRNSNSTVSKSADRNSVCHPTKVKFLKDMKTNFFGPKLQSNNNNNNNDDLTNVKFIETQTYNYGVPVKKQQQNNVIKRHLSSSIANVKRPKSIQSNLNGGDAMLASSRLTADIFVYARKRPMLESESQFNDAIFIENQSGEVETNSICVNEIKTLVDGTPILQKNEFEFDRTFDSNFTNDDIFKSSILPFVNVPLENRNDFTCICFGQTGSGKTHTLFGTKEQEGLCVLTAQALFMNNERLYCGFYEIYNGQLYDLINQNSRLVLREDSNGQVNVVGLVEIEIKNLDQLRKIIDSAQNNRHIGSTSFNRASSRSHAVIQLKIQSIPISNSQTGQQIVINKSHVKSKVNSGISNGFNKLVNPTHRILFIDLAGSERGIDAQNNLNDNRKEGAEINQSLLALKECIRCIDQLCTHAPFRQSKLTRVLRDCFIGVGRTILIATVSPTEDCVSCSLNTLQYANRVRQMTIRNRKKNEKVFKKITFAAPILPFNNEKDVNNTHINHQPITSQSNNFKTTTKQINTVETNNKTTNSSTVNNHASSSTGQKSNNMNNYGEFSSKSLKKEVQISKESKSLITKDIIPNRHVSQSKPKSSKVISSTNKASTDLQANNILPPKPFLKYQSINQTSSTPQANLNVNNNNNAPSLFHPSKINMSSTPIKTNLNGEKEASKGEETLFENDTPIKGHKLKYISGSKAISNLAEKYFTKVDDQVKTSKSILNQVNTDPVIYNRASQPYLSTVQSYNQTDKIQLNERIYCKEVLKNNQDIYKRYNENRNIYEPSYNRKIENIKFKNEDRESGVESDEFAEIAAKVTAMTKTEYPYEKMNDFNNRYPSTGLLNHQTTNFMNNSTKKNNFLKPSIHLTTGSSQLTKLTNELDRINDRVAYRDSYFNNITNSTNKKISDKYVQRYKSIYSLDSPPSGSPTRSPIQQTYKSHLKFDAERFNFLPTRNVSFYDSIKDSSLVSTLKLKNNQDLTRNQANINDIQSNNVSVIEENLIRLRKKQRELLEMKKANNLNMVNNTGNETTDQIDGTFNDCLNINDENSDADIEKLIENSNLLISQLQNDNNASVDMIKQDANSQKQLKTYIHLLETKLVQLRGEMKDQASLILEENSKILNSNREKCHQRERSASSDSCDSLREIKIHHNETNQMYSKVIYSEFLQNKHQLEKEHQKYAEKNKLSTLNEPILFGDDYDKKFIEMQIHNQDHLVNSKMDDSKYLKKTNDTKSAISKNNDDDLDQFSNDENNADCDNLKKSFHKGNSTNLFFSKVDKKGYVASTEKTLDSDALVKKLDLSSLNEPMICEFSPIITQKELNSIESNERETQLKQSHNNYNQIDSNDNSTPTFQLTPRSQFNKNQLVNPIPIRLNSSSSYDSSISKYNQTNAIKVNANSNPAAVPNINEDQSSNYDNQNSSRSLVSSNEGSIMNLKMSNSKIWKATNSQNENTKNTECNMLKENDKFNGLLNPNENDADLKQNQKSEKDHSNKNLKSKDQLVVAHEHQLSDITETCKKEMNLLSCLKESQMGFDDYLNQVEEMLTKKAHSIRDLQEQISQLKTIKTSNNERNEITVNLTTQEKQ